MAFLLQPPGWGPSFPSGPQHRLFPQFGGPSLLAPRNLSELKCHFPAPHALCPSGRCARGPLTSASWQRPSFVILCFPGCYLNTAYSIGYELWEGLSSLLLVLGHLMVGPPELWALHPGIQFRSNRNYSGGGGWGWAGNPRKVSKSKTRIHHKPAAIYTLFALYLQLFT